MAYKVNVKDLLKQIRDVEKINRKRKNPNFKIERVIIIPEKGFNSSEGKHPLEDILLENGFTYDFKGASIGNETTYNVDLRQIDLIY